MGKLSRRQIAIHLAWISAGLIYAAVAAMLLRPYVLTKLHQTEMQQATQHFYETLFSLEGASDPQVVRGIATGEYLTYLVKTRCNPCPSVQVARRISVSDLQVWAYSPVSAKVYAEIEYGWNKVDPVTRQSIGPCHASGFSTIMLFVKQDESWKVSEGEGDYLNSYTVTPERVALLCGVTD